MIVPFLLPSILLAIGGAEEPPKPTCGASIVDANDLLALVNKSQETRLRSDWQPTDLVAIDSKSMAPGHKGFLRSEAAAALAELLSDSQKKRLSIRVNSAYRSFRSQRGVFRSKVRKYGEDKASKMSAMAGHSQHQLGTTVDLSFRRHKWKFSQSQPKSREGRWLTQNAHLYGFVLSYPRGQRKLTGYIHEPWHYRYIGKSAAAEMRRKKIPLERYLSACHSCQSSFVCAR